jgi:hypothetical protein
LLELVRQQDVVAKELRVTNTYLRNGATTQFKYTSSQATQHRDPTFKSTLIKVRRGTSPQLNCCMPSPSHMVWPTWLLAVWDQTGCIYIH